MSTIYAAVSLQAIEQTSALAIKNGNRFQVSTVATCHELTAVLGRGPTEADAVTDFIDRAARDGFQVITRASPFPSAIAPAFTARKRGCCSTSAFGRVTAGPRSANAPKKN